MPSEEKGTENKNQTPRGTQGTLTDRTVEKGAQRPSPSNPGGTTSPSDPTGEKPITGPVNQVFEKSGQIVVDRKSESKGESTRKK